MADKIKLYDMEKQEWRDIEWKLPNRPYWRAKRVDECYICGCKSNHYFMGGWPCIGPRLVCPGRDFDEDIHDELQEKVDNFHYGEGHPKAYLDALEKEIRQVRKKFKNCPSDLAGENLIY